MAEIIRATNRFSHKVTGQHHETTAQAHFLRVYLGWGSVWNQMSLLPQLSRVWFLLRSSVELYNYGASGFSEPKKTLLSQKYVADRPGRHRGPKQSLTTQERIFSIPNGKFKTAEPLIKIALDAPRIGTILVTSCKKSQLWRLVSTIRHLNSYFELQPELLKTKHSHWQAPQLASFPR